MECQARCFCAHLFCSSSQLWTAGSNEVLMEKDMQFAATTTGIIPAWAEMMVPRTDLFALDFRYLDNTSRGCANTNVSYAVALSTITLVAVVVYILQLRFGAATRGSKNAVLARKVSLLRSIYLSFPSSFLLFLLKNPTQAAVTILMLMWTVGAFLCTFNGPYYAAGLPRKETAKTMLPFSILYTKMFCRQWILLPLDR